MVEHAVVGGVIYVPGEAEVHSDDVDALARSAFDLIPGLFASEWAARNPDGGTPGHEATQVHEVDWNVRIRNHVFDDEQKARRRLDRALAQVGPKLMSVEVHRHPVRVRADAASGANDEWPGLVSTSVLRPHPLAIDDEADVFFDWLVASAEGPARGPGVVMSLVESLMRDMLFSVPSITGDQVPLPTWGLWLAQRHLDALGGRERVLAEAPVASIVDRGPAGIVVRVTDKLSEMTPDHQERWREFLAPILIPTGL